MRIGFPPPKNPPAGQPPHGQKFAPRIACLSILSTIAFWQPSAHAIALGNASTRSQVGARLRIEILLEESSADSIDLQCLHLAPQPAARQDELPWLNQGRLSLERKDERQILVVTAGSFNQPALAFGIRIECGASLQRDYTLLLEAPAGETGANGVPLRAPAHESAPLGLPPSGRTVAGPASATEDSERATPPASARAPGPSDTYAQRRSRSVVTPPPGRPAPGSIARDRLLISGGVDDEMLRLSPSLMPRRELGESARERLRAERALLTALDDKIASQLELAERVRQLEALQAKLRDDADRLEREMQAARTERPAPLPPVTPAVEAPLANTQDSGLFPLAWMLGGAAGLLCILACLLWRRQQHARMTAGEAGALSAGKEESDPVPMIEPISEADIWPDEQGRAPAGPGGTGAAGGNFTFLGTTGFGTPSILQVVEGDIEEHDSAVELADIMMSFGRVQGAAQTLADFIRSNPKQAVRPWIKLLEVYRKADMRAEYEALCAQLNRTFNVRPAQWDEFEIARQAPDTLENMPHIMTRLTESWGHRECQALLHRLLRDNRQGTRQGFPLAIVEEIMLLLAILERQLGPYRPDEHGDTAPPTRTLTENSRHIPTLVLRAAPPAATGTPPGVDATAPFGSLLQDDLLHFEENVPAPEQPPPDLARTARLDLDFDMTDLTRTLNIDLDRLDPAPQTEDKP